MTSAKNRKNKESSEKNGHIPNEEKQIDSNKQILTKKVYVVRNSVLTDLMDVNHLQSVYNISVAVCCLLFINAVIFYLAAPDKFWQDILIMWYGVQKLHYFVVLWLMFNLFSYAAFKNFQLWIIVRNNIHAKVADAIFIILFLGASIFMFTATPYTVLKLKMPPITGFATMCEQVRIFMKIYSFVRENVPRALQYEQQKDGSQQHALCCSTSHYFYYLFAPALIYKDSYPQTEKINFKSAFINLFKLASVIFITYCAFMRFNVDQFKNVGLQQFGRQEAALIFAGSMAVGAMMMFLMFYGILHCWLNFAGELTRFGDKQFYQDWWNSTSFSQYYRRWNSVVYDWLHAYIYQDTQRMGFNRSISMVLVFFVSALVHEYIISLSLGFFYPVLYVVYSTLGVSLVFFTKERTSQAWNTFMWFMLFSGWGVIICLYSSEWFARINCSKKETTSLDFFIPRSWDSSCHIFDFSIFDFS